MIRALPIRAALGALVPSHDSGRRDAGGVPLAGGRQRRRRSRNRREQGVALIVVMSAIAVLAVMLADMHENTSTEYRIAVNQRDQLRAEYMARSGINLTRLLVEEEPKIRQTVAPFYQMLFGRPPPQLPVWTLANEILQPFCDYEGSRENATQVGIDLGAAQGMGDLPGTCEIVALAENSKINVNDPLLRDGNQARRSVAMQVFAMIGGYQSPSPYDPLFEQRDPDGNFTSRLDLVSALIDWWDVDTERTLFDPGAGEVSSSGSEDDVYSSFEDPYRVKNAPFDSLEELRLIRGVGDDFWATFVEPNPDDHSTRNVTVYGSGSVNPNEAPPEVLLARLCSFIGDQPLCVDPVEASKFIQLVRTTRAMFPIPFFSRSADFLAFVEGRGGARDLYPMLRAMLGEDHPLLFTPVTIPNTMRTEIDNSFVTAARILTIESTGEVGRTRVRIRTVMNFHDRWTPPPPNAGGMPPLGIFHYYRID